MVRHVKYWPVLSCFLVALILETIPLPDAMQLARPPFLTIAIIYWGMMWPDRIGILTAFFLGLLLDILHGTLLGQNALALSMVAYLTFRFHLQIRIFPVWQLTGAAFALMSASAFLQLWIDGIAGNPSAGLARWISVLVGTALWPVLMGIMDRLRYIAERRNTSLT